MSAVISKQELAEIIEEGDRREDALKRKRAESEARWQAVRRILASLNKMAAGQELSAADCANLRQLLEQINVQVQRHRDMYSEEDAQAVTNFARRIQQFVDRNLS